MRGWFVACDWAKYSVPFLFAVNDKGRCHSQRVYGNRHRNLRLDRQPLGESSDSGEISDLTSAERLLSGAKTAAVGLAVLSAFVGRNPV